MKNLLLNYFAFAILLLAVAACDDKDNNTPDPDPTPGDELVELSGTLTTRTLTADKKYILRGQVFVRDGQVLTVEPGTVIFGDKRTRATLIIDKGGRLEANGTVDRPIVFTSSQEAGVRDRGDWGGLVILGRANTNQPNPAIEGVTPEVNFGTNGSTQFDNESSGTLRYVRVEFGGIELTPNNETNSITMGGVGRGTVMEYNMVSFGGDDGFEWFGGTVNGKYFISHATWDDDFDCDFGWSGNVQFGLVVRYPGFADQSQSNAFECDNGPNDNDVEPYTTGTFSNVTVIGPIATGNSISNGNYAHAVDLRRRTAISIFNSVFTGFPIGLRMNQPSVLANYQAGRGVLENNIMVTPRTQFAAGSGVDVAAVENYFKVANTVVPGPASAEIHTGLGLRQDLFFGSRLPDQYPAAPDFRVTSGTLATGAKFDNAKFNEANRTTFFDKTVQFIGAFGATNWTTGWAEFDPVDKEY
ncbi:MAG TPA: hypothetical protein PKC76_17660 [Saprospiraceae bacterium]|nr:hypothetical protein [Saprospiraceae bacterium]HMP25962.1 hypothetical protein [Saprospiraceae bacterium]